MSLQNKALRKIKNFFLRQKLKNTNFSLLSSNCNGALILHDLKLRYNSPFVDLWMKPKDFIQFVSNIEKYLDSELVFETNPSHGYPTAMLDDVCIYFQHYKDTETASKAWYSRIGRIDLNNLFVLMTDRDGCTEEDLANFEQLPQKNKIIFTNKPHPNISSARYISGFENQESVGVCSEYRNRWSWTKYYDDFDFVAWFNNKE